MKKFLLAAFVTVIAAVSAHANTFVFTDNNPADVYLINPFHSSYTGTFDLTGYGYNPATMQIDSAVTEFTFGDLPGILGGKETFTITWNGDSFSHGSFGGIVVVNPTLSITALADLNTDGILSYTVTSTSKFGDLWLLNAKLTAQASSVPTPDGGATAALLGAGLVGLALLARRK